MGDRGGDASYPDRLGLVAAVDVLPLFPDGVIVES